MANENLNLAPLLEKLGQNPAAVSMLQNLLGGRGGGASAPSGSPHEDTESAESEHSEDSPREGESIPTISFSPPPAPPGYGHGKGRREVLLSLRPFLSEKRCATVDRVLRALELYEVIESTRN